MTEIKLSQVLERELKGRVLSEVAKDAGISKSLLHDWCKAGRNPSGKNMAELKKLANYLGLSLEEILFGETESKEVLASTVFMDGGKQYRVSIERIKKGGN